MFYLKLAWSNLKKNRTTYGPFLGSMIFLVILNLLMQIMLNNQGMQHLPQAMTVRTMFAFGRDVILIFSLIFAFYTNSFLIKRRRKELGLYNILGMDKRSLGLMLFLESALSLLLSLVAGLGAGVILSKFLFLVLKKMTGFGAAFSFQLTPQMFIFVAVFFIVIFGVLFFYNSLQLVKNNPIELLRGGETGEKEPKSRWLLTLVGAVALGAGYYLSLSIKSPVEALTIFFLAIVLVIIGTYSLLIAASVTVLKYLRGRSHIYYQPRPFVNISGMIFRMKQNGAGLASICILSTMVLVTISSTAGLFFGQEDVLKTRNPHDISFSTQLADPDAAAEVLRLAAANEITIDEQYTFELPNIPLLSREEDQFTVQESTDLNFRNMAGVELFTLAEYQKNGGKPVVLTADEVLLFVSSGEYTASKMTFGTKVLQVKEKLAAVPFAEAGEAGVDGYLLVVKDQSVIQEIIASLTGSTEAVSYSTELVMNISGDQENRQHFAAALNAYSEVLNAEHQADSLPNGNQDYSQTSSVDEDRETSQAFTGGFLFIGIIFGLSFMVAMALMIYYKQISEGYEDARRFDIMQKVGMSHKEVRRTISNQILMVFLLPIALAVTHLAFALPIIRKLLILFGLTNQSLISQVTLITVGIFALFYVVFYWQTSKVYYRIVERKN